MTDAPHNAAPAPSPPADVTLAHYSAALDEVWRLRTALAYEAQVIQSRLGSRATASGHRSPAAAQADRMRRAAQGHLDSHASIAHAHLRAAGQAAGLTGLTRWMWENNVQS